MNTVIVKVGDYYTFYHYEKNNFSNGRFGCTISKDKSVLENILNRK